MLIFVKMILLQFLQYESYSIADHKNDNLTIFFLFVKN